MAEYKPWKTAGKFVKEWIWGAIGAVLSFTGTWLAGLPVEYQTGTTIMIMSLCAGLHNWYKHHNK